jgi:hypothetical protein
MFHIYLTQALYAVMPKHKLTPKHTHTPLSFFFIHQVVIYGIKLANSYTSFNHKED